MSGAQALITLRKENGELIGRGYELICQCAAQIPTGPQGEMETFNFSERLQVIQSEDLRAAQAKSLQDWLRSAQTEIKALTPEPGRGRHQYRDEESFKAALAAVIEKHKVAGLLEVGWEVEEQKETRLIGLGRPSADRPRREIVKRCYVVKSIKRDQKAIFEARRRPDWRVQLSNAPEEVSLQTCVNHYRANWRGERNYNRFQGRTNRN